VYPSLYEPFGIVALEAMAAQVPVVVSDVGGLREVVDHGVTGLTAWADNPDSLAWAILRVLKNPYSAKQMAQNAYRKVQDQFSWDRIAEQTASVYERVWAEYLNSDWGGDKSV
ncbi:MAG: glycosyltransferase, partial [Armatimonadota bacterium]